MLEYLVNLALPEVPRLRSTAELHEARGYDMFLTKYKCQGGQLYSDYRGTGSDWEVVTIPVTVVAVTDEYDMIRVLGADGEIYDEYGYECGSDLLSVETLIKNLARFWEW
jgi:hypothetical protein